MAVAPATASAPPLLRQPSQPTPSKASEPAPTATPAAAAAVAQSVAVAPVREDPLTKAFTARKKQKQQQQ
jgi:hypothetical protein